jgi:acyl-coenzyme A thioesterase 13
MTEPFGPRRSDQPDGFVPYYRPSPYLNLIGPMYQSATDASVVRLLVDERHTNARGFLHAGVLVAIADTIMGHTLQRSQPTSPSLVTVSLTTDFTGSAQVGDWLEGRAEVRRQGRRVSFAKCEFQTMDRVVLAASGIFASAPAKATT